MGTRMHSWFLAVCRHRVAAALAASWASERRTWLQMVFNAAIAWLLLSTVPKPTEQAVAELLRTVQKVGAAVLLLGVIATYMDVVLAGIKRRRVDEALKAALAFSRNSAVYSLTLWLVGAFGDLVYQASAANPLAAAVNLVALVLLWPLVRQAVMEPLGRSRDDFAEGVAAVAAAQTPCLTARDRDHAAAHEAGHVMAYAALEELPAGLVVQMHASAQLNGSIGIAGGWSSDHQLLVRSFVEWRMVVDLAGQVAEQQLLGEASLGAIQDHEVWLSRAQGYLALQVRGAFYPRPRNAFEQARNDEALEALRTEQLNLLGDFFVQNASLLSEIAGTLAERGRLDLEDLRPMLARAIVPKGFPRAAASNFNAAAAAA